MTYAELYYFFEPFVVIFNWMRKTYIHLMGFSFTFMDVFVWTLFAGIAIWFINKVMFDD